MALTIAKVIDAVVYVNNSSKHGQASEVTCPTVSFKNDEFNALGMIGTPSFFSGIEAMEASIKWTYPDNEAYMELSNPFEAVDIMVRSNKGVWNNGGKVEDQSIVIFMSVLPKEHQSGTFQSKEATEVESPLSVNYYKLMVDGEDIIEVDVINNVFKIDGEDMIADWKTNLGI
jgi:P2 family phage contractile tail tube protein